MAGVDLFVGHLCHSHPDTPLTLRNAGKTKSLLVNLVLEPHYTASRETLLQAIWPNVHSSWPTKRSTASFTTCAAGLSYSLAGAAPVLCADGQCRLNVEAGIELDVAWFEACAAEGDRLERDGQMQVAAAHYEAAVQAYRGDLCAVNNTPALMLCEALRARYLNSLARLADYHFGLGHYAECLRFAEQLLRTDPCREDAHRLVMRCYLRQGQRAQALHHYQLCANVLKAEFDAVPEPLTQILYEQIRLNPDRI